MVRKVENSYGADSIQKLEGLNAIKSLSPLLSN